MPTDLDVARVDAIDPRLVHRNLNNPRRFFNDESLDILRTSIQEVGILVPLIVYEDPQKPGQYILMDGERRWSSAIDLGLEAVPANIIPPPSPLENLLRMFNIHSVRDEWPLISVALSLRDVIRLSGEDREARLSEMTGLTRSTVRRAKRLLSLPQRELDLIQAEAHLDRSVQVHREDLYLEVEAAVSVIRSAFPEVGKTFSREKMIREFVRKRELDALQAVTDYRYVGRIIKAGEDDVIDRDTVHDALVELIVRADVNPRKLFDEIAARAYEQQTIGRKAELLAADLAEIETGDWTAPFLEHLRELQKQIDRILRQADA
jgi:ParB family transcriptional regulator, chromosome partitioning protein